MPLLAKKHLPISNKDLLSWIFDDPQYDKDKPVYIDAADPSRSISFSQAKVFVRKLVAGLKAAGLKNGDCVCVSSFNDIYYSLLFLGIVAAGGIFTGTNPSYTPFELTHHIETAHVRFIVTEPELLPNIQQAARDCHIPQSRIWIFNVRGGQKVPTGFESWLHLTEYGERDWVRFNDKTMSTSTPAAFIFSSGTTGLPKAAVYSHHNLVAQHTLAIEPEKPPYMISRLIYLPMFHAAVVPVGHTTPLKSGDKTYVLRRFELEPFCAAIQTFQITELPVVPPIVLMILASPAAKSDNLRSVKNTQCGAASLNKVHQRRFEELLAPDASFNQVWGMTETTCVASRFWYPENDETGSIGRFISNLDVKIVDERDNDVTAPGARGELLIRGPTIISGYYENPAANSASFDSEGYFRTGDIVTCVTNDGGSLADAKWYMVDRKKELIKVRGFQVSPAELEAVILQHPAVVDVAVIGVKLEDSPDGEHPRAYIVLRPATNASAVTGTEMKTWCSQRLAKYKELTGGVVFVDILPRNASGKLLKRVLKEEAERKIKDTRIKEKL
ncbi:uncharacterized protein PV06_10678 [Exophiala oligosperma]|uniref:Uncharacterized protein n=1 Tax=Exophiala oligosperma TaxID=215243 RepID=A0A0D2DMV3_9EURO|nr:uncharacterized protein PV06_10678 [Exophiala oligosperma]KIW37049.1 hypothetical protein PV06_10678 [Exophiala oligosperma]